MLAGARTSVLSGVRPEARPEENHLSGQQTIRPRIVTDSDSGVDPQKVHGEKARGMNTCALSVGPSDHLCACSKNSKLADEVPNS